MPHIPHKELSFRPVELWGKLACTSTKVNKATTWFQAEQMLQGGNHLHANSSHAFLCFQIFLRQVSKKSRPGDEHLQNTRRSLRPALNSGCLSSCFPCLSAINLHLIFASKLVLQLIMFTVEAPNEPNVWAEQKKIGEKLVFPPDDCSTVTWMNVWWSTRYVV